MGDAFDTSEQPTLEIAVQGTAPIAKLHVIRDNKYVFSTEPERDGQVKLRYTDDDAQPGRDALLLRPRRAGRRQPRLGLADVDHVQGVSGAGSGGIALEEGRPVPSPPGEG